jgi:murein DD-endopeptidase MepM/ murein hydrolase activator NlpD
MIFRLLTLLLFASLVFSCTYKKLPKQTLKQFQYKKEYRFSGDSLHVEIINPLHCPLRVWIQSTDTLQQRILSKKNPFLLPPFCDTSFVFSGFENSAATIRFAARLGDPAQEINPVALELPFPRRRWYRIIQGNNSKPTHRSDWSRFAIDFALAEKDTICAATDGYVVGVIDGYKFGGPDAKWRPFGNFITLFDPVSGYYTQYVHLCHEGSLVKVGDRVEKGMPIALSGKTGQTDVEHLHFNCLVPVNTSDGMKSTPVEFIEGYKGEALKRNMVVRKL